MIGTLRLSKQQVVVKMVRNFFEPNRSYTFESAIAACFLTIEVALFIIVFCCSAFKKIH